MFVMKKSYSGSEFYIRPGRNQTIDFMTSLCRLRHFCQSNDLFRPRSQVNYKLTYFKVTEFMGNGMFMYNISLNALFYLPQNVTWQNPRDTFIVVFPNKLQTLEGAQFEVRIILIIWSSSDNLIGNDVQ